MAEKKSLSRRTFIKGAMGFAGLAALGAGVSFLPRTELMRTIENKKHSLLQDKQVQYLRQMITADSTSSRGLMWQAEREMTDPKVLLRLKGDKQEKEYPVEKKFFIEDGSQNFQYHSEISSLSENSDYEYAVKDGDNISDWHSLHTPKAQQDEFSMLVFPDSQSANYSDWKNLAQMAWK